MRKERYITRTIESTKAKVLIYHKNTKQTHEEDFILSGTNLKEITIFNKVQAILETSERSGEKVVAVLESEKVESFYVMSEKFFIENATPFENRDAFVTATKTRKGENE